jgi:hypothetical protein
LDEILKDENLNNHLELRHRQDLLDFGALLVD